MFQSFQELSANTPTSAFSIATLPRTSDVLVMAPHGGNIELGSSELAHAVAGSTFSVYEFRGHLSETESWGLHITSTRFDEPQALEMVAGADRVVAIHGRNWDDDFVTIIGGLDRELAEKIEENLREAGFDVQYPPPQKYAGASPLNICNRNTRGGGVQLELPTILRESLLADSVLMERYARAIRSAIQESFTEDYSI